MARTLIAAALCASLALAGQAAAQAAAPATLIQVNGEVLVSRDGRLVPAAPGALKAGDRIVARAGGQARLSYADGCVIGVKPNAMATIAAKSPCAGGLGLVTAGATSAQTAQTQELSVLQWAGVGLTVVVLGVGLAAAADDLSISN